MYTIQLHDISFYYIPEWDMSVLKIMLPDDALTTIINNFVNSAIIFDGVADEFFYYVSTPFDICGDIEEGCVKIILYGERELANDWPSYLPGIRKIMSYM